MRVEGVGEGVGCVLSYIYLQQQRVEQLLLLVVLGVLELQVQVQPLLVEEEVVQVSQQMARLVRREVGSLREAMGGREAMGFLL
jgi:hypothetical protein